MWRPSGRKRVPPPTTTECEEDATLIDQPGLEGVAGQLGAADADVTVDRRLHPADGIGVERSLEARPRGPDLV